MTCIIGLVHGARVYIGGDSAAVSDDGYDMLIRGDTKVFLNGDYAVGYTSSFRMGQILRFSKLPEPPPHGDQETLYRFMCTDFIDTVRRRLLEGGWARKEHEVESGGAFVVGVRGSLFTVLSEYQVQQYEDPFCAVGCGYAFALGSLWTMGRELPAEQQIQTAMEAAGRYSSWVRAPFHIVSVLA